MFPPHIFIFLYNFRKDILDIHRNLFYRFVQTQVSTPFSVRPYLIFRLSIAEKIVYPFGISLCKQIKIQFVISSMILSFIPKFLLKCLDDYTTDSITGKGRGCFWLAFFQSSQIIWNKTVCLLVELTAWRHRWLERSSRSTGTRIAGSGPTADGRKFPTRIATSFFLYPIVQIMGYQVITAHGARSLYRSR